MRRWIHHQDGLGTAPGDGLFEAVKVVDGRPFALARHLDRLAGSAQLTGLPEVDLDLVRSGVAELLSAEPLALGRLRILHAPPVLVVEAAAMAAQPPTTTVVTVGGPRNERGVLVGHKTTAYAENLVALATARAAGAGEALVADTRGHLCEGTASNIFYVVDGELRTPSLATGCLPGVTRALLLEWYGAREVAEPLEEVRASASEAFLVSTTRDVQGITRWDDRDLPAPGPVTRDAARVFAERAPGLLGV
ncbi:MAG: aminotransferase class IV [Nocardioides sp.]